MHGRARVERLQACAKGVDGGRRGQVGLRQQQSVGDGRLLHRFRVGLQGRHAVHAVDRGDHAVEAVDGDDQPVPHQRVQDGRRVGEPRGLDHDALERRDHAVLAAAEEVLQRAQQVAARRAAEAAALQLDDVLAGLPHQRMVEADLAELVDDDGGVGEGGLAQQAGEHGRLAAAEEAGEDRDRDQVRRRASRHGGRPLSGAGAGHARNSQRSSPSCRMPPGTSPVGVSSIVPIFTWAGRATA